jgi:hypothetical protein
MNSLKLEATPGDDESAVDTSLEGNIRELVRVRMLKAHNEVSGDVTSDTIGPLVQKVGATPIAEIERLIGELEAARNYLKSEADRIQREMARYEYLCNTASGSVKIITHSLGQWRNSSSDAAHNVAGEDVPSHALATALTGARTQKGSVPADGLPGAIEKLLLDQAL